MTSKPEQFYKRRIAELEAQLKQRDQRIATLEKQVAEILKANAKLTEQVIKLTGKIAKLSKNSSNSSKPPSSNIIKPPKPKQPGHKSINRQLFGPERIDRTVELYAGSCDCGYKWPWSAN